MQKKNKILMNLQLLFLQLKYYLSNLLVILLSPILLIQVYKLKNTIPILSQAKEPQEGLLKSLELNNNKNQKIQQINKTKKQCLSILTIGESSTVGAGLDSLKQTIGYKIPQLLQKRIEFKNIDIKFAIKGRNGYTIQKLYEKIIPKINIKDYDIVILQDSANDIMKFTSPFSFFSTHVQLFKSWIQQNPEIQIYLPNPPPFQHFPVLKYPLNKILGIKTSIISQTQDNIVKYCQIKYPNLIIKHAYNKNKKLNPSEFDQKHFAKDNFHPSELTNGEWSEEIQQFIDLPKKFLEN